MQLKFVCIAQMLLNSLVDEQLAVTDHGADRTEEGWTASQLITEATGDAGDIPDHEDTAHLEIAATHLPRPFSRQFVRHA